jgi:uncharacterized protein with von Willebrand factor type A (vWA) domain
VTFNEWLLLQNALSENLADSSLTRFYYLARAILIKTEAHFDKYDQAFLECFGHIESDEDLIRTIEERLLQIPPLDLTEEEKRMVEQLSLEEVRARFLEQLKNQDDELHIGGNKAIGIRGRSTHGAWGYNPAGIRIGQHESRMHSAIQIAERRSFKNYRDDVTLDIRSIKTVLSFIRQVVREGPKDSLDVDGTIDATCRNAGELEFIWDRARKKRIKLMLLMDAGGTMTPHTDLVSRLFSAAKDIVKDLQFYYFHNCIYQELYTDIWQMKAVSTRKVLDQANRNYKVIWSAMPAWPEELLNANGAMIIGIAMTGRGSMLIEIGSGSEKYFNPSPKTGAIVVIVAPLGQKVFPMCALTMAGMRSGPDVIKHYPCSRAFGAMRKITV